ncbi:alpha/beta hydrolase [Sphingomonas sp. BK069]|uniref:alpha/beta hydrolase n=1 Tax=Sphingomonas sp. BK069 TaxID=2586979 RepID=UPI00160FF7DF|nr:alpha/beta hydrolase [Sphingomonas sp. BK069]MBB3346377.1 acetyl esterase [Sphingomonas sp. BK069]
MTDRTVPEIERAPFVRPDVAAFLTYLNSVPGPRMHELPPAGARAVMVAMKDVADLPRAELAVVRDLTLPGPGGELRARLFDARETRAPGPAVVFYHGGGWVIGDLDTHASFTAEMARQLDLPVISVDYRLAPEARWPAAPDDAEAAARWVASAPEALGRGVTSLVLSGDSAGGNLAIIVAAALRDRLAAVPVIVQAPIYPATDASRPYASFDAFADGYLLTREGMIWFNEHYAGDPHHPRFSPLLGDVAGLPRAVIVTAGLDPIRDQGRAYAAALAQAGIPVTFREAQGNIHGFITLRRAIPSSQGDVAGFLTAVRAAVSEAEGERVLRQAAG